MNVLHVRPSARDRATGAIFEGEVHTQPVVGEPLSASQRVLEVAFRGGARTKLHAHTTDQVLFITEGKGVVGTTERRWDVGPGDVVFIPAAEPHFHGAAPGADMTHYSVLGAASETTVIEG